ncbi:MAG: carbohydrate porin [Candidatus Brocadiales bacterium]|nr:carbohydrate porin [Candidatus Brocadiales bacterium]
MLKKLMSVMVVIVSCASLCNLKIGKAADVNELEQRLDSLETRISEVSTTADDLKGEIGKYKPYIQKRVDEACKVTEDLKVALEKYRPAYGTDVCEGRIKFGGRIDGMVQYLSGTDDRDQLGVVGRLWFDARAKVVPDQLDFITELNSAGGNNIGAGLPSNEITIDRSAFNDLGRGNINLYKAHTIWKPVKGLQIAAGIMDWLNHEDPTGTSGDVGFDNSDMTICEGWSFPSLSVGAWLGLVSELKADAPSVPALTLRYDPIDLWTLRTSIQTTQTSSMFTTRNDSGARDLTSWTSEIVFRPKIFGLQGAYKIFYGLTKSGDSSPADTATGAALNPSGINSGVGFLFDQWLSSNFLINARYSVSEDDDTFKSSNNGVRSHWNATIGWISDGDTYSAKEFVGVGYGSARWGHSYEKAFNTSDRENTVDVFWRHKLTNNVWLEPNLQVVDSPLGAPNDTEVIPGLQMWMTF